MLKPKGASVSANLQSNSLQRTALPDSARQTTPHNATSNSGRTSKASANSAELTGSSDSSPRRCCNVRSSAVTGPIIPVPTENPIQPSDTCTYKNYPLILLIGIRNSVFLALLP